MSYSKPFWLLALCVVVGCSDTNRKAPEQQVARDKPPNILLIVVDDLGYTDIAPYGSEVSTPTLSALAERG